MHRVENENKKEDAAGGITVCKSWRWYNKSFVHEVHPLFCDMGFRCKTQAVFSTKLVIGQSVSEQLRWM